MTVYETITTDQKEAAAHIITAAVAARLESWRAMRDLENLINCDSDTLDTAINEPAAYSDEITAPDLADFINTNFKTQ